MMVLSGGKKREPEDEENKSHDLESIDITQVQCTKREMEKINKVKSKLQIEIDLLAERISQLNNILEVEDDELAREVMPERTNEELSKNLYKIPL